MNGLTKVCAYCRVSTDRFEQENSFENQKAYFQEFLNEDNGFELIDIYADKGLTGTKFANRLEFNRMLLDAGLDVDIVNGKSIYTANKFKEPKFKYIYVTNSSRFARNIEIVTIIRALKDKGVYVVFKDLNKTTENPEDEMVLQLIFTLDEQESRDKSIKVRNGHLRSAMRTDRIHTNGRLYGYKFIEHENRLEIIEEEAEVVRLIFELCSQGYGNRRIREYLIEKGIKTRNNKDFHTSTINNILHNIKYTGTNNRLEFKAPTVFGNKTTIERVKNNPNYKLSEKIPSIISIDLYEQCKELRNTRLAPIEQGKKAGANTGKTIYSKRIICSKCGATYIMTTDRGRHFFICSNKKRHGVKACNNKNISLKEIENLTDEYMNLFYPYIIDRFKFFEKVINQRIEICNNNSREEDKLLRIKEVEKEILENKNKLNMILDLYLNSSLTKDILENKQEEINNIIVALENELNNLKAGVDEWSLLKDGLTKIRSEIKNKILKTKIIKKDKLFTTAKIYIKEEEVIIESEIENLINETLKNLKVNV